MRSKGNEMLQEEIENYKWEDWRSFPNPSEGGYIYAPFGPGVYQLRNIKSKECILFGRSKNLACRMSTLLPLPFGCGGRDNLQKKEYVLQNIVDIEYRTVGFLSEGETKVFEKLVKSAYEHKFNENGVE